MKRREKCSGLRNNGLKFASLSGLRAPHLQLHVCKLGLVWHYGSSIRVYQSLLWGQKCQNRDLYETLQLITLHASERDLGGAG